jgi:orotidine-5'-phosphate decarboxylase
LSEARTRLVAALDLPDRRSACSMADRLAAQVGWFKVGLELFVAEGPRIVAEVAERGRPVFLDLKLHDIPNTVAAAVRSAARLGAGMLTLHAAGGRSMLEAAREAAGSATSPPLLLGVTALTSLGSAEVAELAVSEPVEAWALRLAGIAAAAGIGGIVASACEIPALRAAHPGLRLVVPGIRPAGAPMGDQRRVATPEQAIRAGASYLVVGRPILEARDPVAAAGAIVEEISRALDRAT